jgi:sulfatase maturation enzyme AslB (radical SAM superfamily)
MDEHKICGAPFTGFMLYVDQYKNNRINAMICCPSWLKYPYNSYSTPVPEDSSGFLNIDKIWNSDEMIKFRKSVVDGDYSFCNKDICPAYLSYTFVPVPDRAKELIKDNNFQIDYAPLYTHVSIDRSCNLKCPSCRKDHISVSDMRTYNRMKSILASGIETLDLSGSGELFKNQYLLKALNEITEEEYPNLKYIDIISNGTLLSKEMWDSLSDPFKKRIRDINISVDATTEQTYKKIRVTGDFNKLFVNLYYLGELKKENKFRNFTLSFVLQKANILELSEFPELVKKVNANKICITKILDWGVFSPKDFSEIFALPDNWKDLYKDVIEKAQKNIIDNNIISYSNIF